jgi:nicotinamidase-related amidase
MVASAPEWELVGQTALLFVHMQNAIVKAPSVLEPLGHIRATEEDKIIPNMEKLLAAFRAKGLTVVFVNAYTPEGTKLPVYGRFWPSLSKHRVNYKGTPDVEVIDELKPHPGEPLFYNWPFGIFQGNEMEKYLADKGIETIVLAGVATGMAVGVAAFALADRFYNIIVPSDTATDGNKELHEVIFKAMLPAIALVTTTDDVIAHL